MKYIVLSAIAVMVLYAFGMYRSSKIWEDLIEEKQRTFHAISKLKHKKSAVYRKAIGVGALCLFAATVSPIPLNFDLLLKMLDKNSEQPITMSRYQAFGDDSETTEQACKENATIDFVTFWLAGRKGQLNEYVVGYDLKEGATVVLNEAVERFYLVIDDIELLAEIYRIDGHLYVVDVRSDTIYELVSKSY